MQINKKCLTNYTERSVMSCMMVFIFLKHFLNIYEKMLCCIDFNASLVNRLGKTVDFNCDFLAYIFLRKNYRAKGFKQHRNSF